MFFLHIIISSKFLVSIIFVLPKHLLSTFFFHRKKFEKLHWRLIPSVFVCLTKLISPLHWQIILLDIGFKVAGFFLSTLNISPCSLLACMKRSMIKFLSLFLSIYFPYCCLQDICLSFLFFFSSLNVICISGDIFHIYSAWSFFVVSSMVWCSALILEKSQPLQFKYFSLYSFSSFLFFLFLFSYFLVLPFCVWYILQWFYSFGIFCFIFYFCISACVVSIYISSSSPILSSACLICWGFMKAIFTSIAVCFYC